MGSSSSSSSASRPTVGGGRFVEPMLKQGSSSSMLPTPSQRLLDPMYSPSPSPSPSPELPRREFRSRVKSPPKEEPAASLPQAAADILAAKVDAQHSAGHHSHREPEADIFQSWCVLTNTILGVGTLSLPWAVSAMGLGLGVVCLMIAGALASLALHFLARISIAMTKGSTGPAEVTFYGACMEAAPTARFVVDAAIAVKCFGVATSYLQVIGQLGASLLLQSSQVCPALAEALQRAQLVQGPVLLAPPEPLRRFVIAVAVLSIAPVVFHKRITKTSLQNLLAICAWLYISVLVIVYSVGLLPLPPAALVTDEASPWTLLPPRTMDGWTVASTVPIFIFSFTCHQNLFTIANELKQRSVPRLNVIAFGAVAAGATMYAAVGVGGYMRFGGEVHENILLNLPQSPLVLLGKVWVIIAIAFTYPLQLHPARRSVAILVSASLGRFLSRREDRILRRTLTVLILAGTGTLAALIKDLGLVLAFVGAVGSNTVVFIMPAFIFMKLMRRNGGLMWYVALLVFIIGCVLLPTCLTAVVRKALA